MGTSTDERFEIVNSVGSKWRIAEAAWLYEGLRSKGLDAAERY